jgi:hypothetical protein
VPAWRWVSQGVTKSTILRFGISRSRDLESGEALGRPLTRVLAAGTYDRFNAPVPAQAAALGLLRAVSAASRSAVAITLADRRADAVGYGAAQATSGALLLVGLG